jgi:hypothetical protein
MPEPQVLKIEPEQELKFKGPFSTATTSLLKLSNPTDRRICFKIKTTAPKRYCVRPNAGILDPGVSISIAVVFQPCELEPTANKHKFMVQALYIPDGEINLEDIWKNVDQTKLMDTKLRCTFEMPSDVSNLNDLNTVQEAQAQRGRSRDEDMTMKSMSAEDNRGGDSGISHEAGQLKAENARLREEVDRLKRRIKAREANERSMMDQAVAIHPTPYMLFLVGGLLAVMAGLLLGKFL